MYQIKITWLYLVKLQMTKKEKSKNGPEKNLKLLRVTHWRAKNPNQARMEFICRFLLRTTGRILQKVLNAFSFWHLLCLKGNKPTCCNESLFLQLVFLWRNSRLVFHCLNLIQACNQQLDCVLEGRTLEIQFLKKLAFHT